MSATNSFEAQANALFAVIGTMMPLFQNLDNYLLKRLQSPAALLIRDTKQQKGGKYIPYSTQKTLSELGTK